MNLFAIFSKTGKGVQEASGKTSHLSRADRNVLKEIDGKSSLANISAKFDKIPADKFDALIQQLDKDGYIREVSSGSQSAAPAPRPAAPAAKAPPPKADDGDEALDFTQAVKLPPKAPAAPAGPKAPQVDLAAAARADSDRKAKEQQGFDYRARQEAEAKAKAEADLKARAEAKARADADAKTHAEADAKVKAAREAAVRMATEAKARAEADSRAKSAELNAKLDVERKAREDAERRATEAADVARKELEQTAKRDAEELRQRLEAEMKAKLDEERKAREAEDRKRREEEDRKRRKEEEERRAKEDAERKAREEEDRKRREADDRRRKEDEERRAREDAERKAREEADRKKREEEDRKRAKEEAERRELEDTSRRMRAEEDRKRAEEERRRREDDERRAKEDAERKARATAEASASLPSLEPIAPPPPPPAAAAPAAGGGIGDSLLADLDSFGQREEEEQRAKEEAERKAKEDAARKAKEAAERKAKEEADRKRREEEERRRKEDEARRAEEEAGRKAREEEERRAAEEAERKRKAKEAMAARQAEEKAAKAAAGKSTASTASAGGAAKGGDDIVVSDDDLDTDDLKRDQKVAAEKARKVAREQPAVLVATGGRPRKWGKTAAIALFVVLVGGVGVLQVMPVGTKEYETAASEALGAPVKIGSARLSLITGIEMKFENVTIGGDAVKIRYVRGFPEIGSLFGARKSFSRLELDGVSVSQSQLADAVLGKVAGENFRVGRVVIKGATLAGPLQLPQLDVEAVVSGDGSLQSLTLSGGDKLVAKLFPKGSEIGFEISAGTLALPLLPALSLSEFGMKGTANRQGVTSSEWDGRAFDGVISGTARIRWGASWVVDGEVRARGLKVAVFAPALVSEGKVDGRATYSMAGSTPATLREGARMQGEFKIEKGVLGSFDLTRALQTGGSQTGGRTVFTELSGQGLYDKGVVQITNVAIAAGAMNAGASLNIDANGGLSGRIVADVKAATQTLRATLNVSGKVQDPVIRK